MNAWTGSTVPELASVFEDGLHVLMVTKDLFQATGLPAEPATGGVPMDTSPEEDTTVATERALFSWQQEGLNIDLAIPIPANLTAKDVECIIQPTTLKYLDHRLVLSACCTLKITSTFVLACLSFLLSLTLSFPPGSGSVTFFLVLFLWHIFFYPFLFGFILP